jgi:hypothetical protein
MKHFWKWFKKNIEQIEYNKFLVSIKTNSHFMIRYPKKDYTPKIGECISGHWSKTMNIIKNKILYIEVFVNNQKKIINLPCEIKIEELDNDNCVINISNFTFNVETEVENLKWIKFEIKSILD